VIGGVETERNDDKGSTTERDGKEMQRSIRANTLRGKCRKGF
jgi:hypothetical protein